MHEEALSIECCHYTILETERNSKHSDGLKLAASVAAPSHNQSISLSRRQLIMSLKTQAILSLTFPTGNQLFGFMIQPSFTQLLVHTAYHSTFSQTIN